MRFQKLTQTLSNSPPIKRSVPFAHTFCRRIQLHARINASPDIRETAVFPIFGAFLRLAWEVFRGDRVDVYSGLEIPPRARVLLQSHCGELPEVVLAPGGGSVGFLTFHGPPGGIGTLGNI